MIERMARLLPTLLTLMAFTRASLAVDFETEILPFLKESCLACHNQTKAKADLVLETPQTILKGGESGPAVLAGKPDESLLLKLAEHREKPFMPPKDNKVNAPDLTAPQLRLLRLWIEQGATGEVRGAQQIVWQSLRDTVRPILSLAVTEDGQFAACGRGNQLVIYRLPTRRALPPLVDPGLRTAQAAHLDLVESLDFSPDGEWLASGSYREVKLWRRQRLSARGTTNTAPAGGSSEATSPDGKMKAVAGPAAIRLLNVADGKLLKELKGDHGSALRLAQWERSRIRATNHLAYRKTMLEKAEKERQTQIERVRKASDAVGLALKALAEQTNQVTTAKAEGATVEKELATVPQRLKEAQESSTKLVDELAKAKAALKEFDAPKVDQLIALAAKVALATNQLVALKSETEKSEKAAAEKLKAAQKKIADAEALLKRGQLTNATVENELTFAIAAAQAAVENVTASQNFLQTAETDLKQIDAQLQAAQKGWTNSLAPAVALAFAPDASLLGSAAENGDVTIWSTATGAPLETISCHATNLWFGGDNALFTASPEKTEAWDLTPRWKLERTLSAVAGQPAFADRVNAVRFSPDGQSLATAGGEPSRSGEVKIWRVRDGQLMQDLKSLHSDAVLALAFSPDGRYLASGGADRFAKITEVASGKLIRVLEGHSHHVLSLDWKADGHTVVTAGADNLLKFWDAFSGEKKKGPEAFNKEITAVAYIQATDQVLASSGDAILRILKESGEKVRSFEGAPAYLQTAVTTRDASLILAGGQDGVLRMWDAETAALLSAFAP